MDDHLSSSMTLNSRTIEEKRKTLKNGDCSRDKGADTDGKPMSTPPVTAGSVNDLDVTTEPCEPMGRDVKPTAEYI